MSLRQSIQKWMENNGSPPLDEELDELCDLVAQEIRATAETKPIDGAEMLEGSGESVGGKPVVAIRCGACLNEFWVPEIPENSPCNCCYCATEFGGYIE